tara:strand:+ start:863 stop:1354 length:492 start_codon:yes stop_codon:yes gene_type:complete
MGLKEKLTQEYRSKKTDTIGLVICGVLSLAILPNAAVFYNKYLPVFHNSVERQIYENSQTLYRIGDQLAEEPFDKPLVDQAQEDYHIVLEERAMLLRETNIVVTNEAGLEEVPEYMSPSDADTVSFLYTMPSIALPTFAVFFGVSRRRRKREIQKLEQELRKC